MNIYMQALLIATAMVTVGAIIMAVLIMMGGAPH